MHPPVGLARSWTADRVYPRAHFLQCLNRSKPSNQNWQEQRTMISLSAALAHGQDVPATIPAIFQFIHAPADNVNAQAAERFLIEWHRRVDRRALERIEGP